MPPEEYTTVTISDETVENLAAIMANNELDSISEAADHVADVACDSDTLSNAGLARLSYRRLADRYQLQ